MEIRELGGHRLADDDRAGFAQARHRRAIAHRLAALEDGRAAFGLVIGGVEYVFDGDRNAVQRSDRIAIAAALVKPARLLQRFVRIEMNEGVHLAVDRSDALETSSRHFLSGDVAACYPLGSLDRGE